MLDNYSLNSLFGHLAFLLTGMSFFMKDIFWLRIVSILASILAIIYAIFGHTEILLLQAYWHGLFICIHLFRLYLRFHDLYILRLTESEKKIYHFFKSELSPSDFKEILNLSIKLKNSEGKVLIHQGKPVQAINFIIEGTVSIKKDNDIIGNLSTGSFFGELSFLTENLASSTVVAQTDISYICWDQEVLKKYLNKESSLFVNFQKLLITKFINY